MTPFRQKAKNFVLFGLSDNDQILLACGINTHNGITNRISDFGRVDSGSLSCVEAADDGR